MNLRITKILLLLTCMGVLASCSSNKKIAYLQNMQEGVNYSTELRKETILSPNDLIAISVTCAKPELAIPFNSYNGAVKVGESGDLTSVADGYRHNRDGYRIDSEGNVQMPILGKIRAEGLTPTQLENNIRFLIIDGDYIIDPQVSVELLNFKYTVLGAVGHTGTFNADGDRVTLFEALANAGDIAENGDHSKVSVIREDDGKYLRIDHDMRNMNTLNSPHFYLQPNDIVYVEPKYKKRDGEDKRSIIMTTLMSIASVIFAGIWAFK